MAFLASTQVPYSQSLPAFMVSMQEKDITAVAFSFNAGESKSGLVLEIQQSYRVIAIMCFASDKKDVSAPVDNISIGIRSCVWYCER